MIYSLKGVVAHLEHNMTIIECNNIGFKCSISGNTSNNLNVGKDCKIYTYMHVKEDGINLFGFSNEEELNCFKILISISGVGPKAAISILSQFTPQNLALAIASNDGKSIAKTPGIGPKTANRIILELKDKLLSPSLISVDENYKNNNLVNKSVFQEAIEALKSLGYLESDILKVVSKYDENLSTEEIIKKALKEL